MFMVNFLFSHHHLFGAQSFLFFLCHSFFLCAHIIIFIYTVHDGCLYVTDTLSTPTITEPPSVKCQDLLIPCQIECMEKDPEIRKCFTVYNLLALALCTMKLKAESYRNTQVPLASEED